MDSHFLIPSKYSEQLKNRAKKYFEIRFQESITGERVEQYLDSLGELFLAFRTEQPPLSGGCSEPE